MTLAVIMGLCLLGYNLGQRQLRQALQQSNQTLLNQDGIKQVVNMRGDRRWILQFLGSACQQYYLLCWRRD